MNSEKTSLVKAADALYYITRVLIIFSAVLLFIPAFNPARICEMINKNMSLFTSSVSYSSLTSEFGRAFKKEWVDESSLKLLFSSAIAVTLGIVANGVGGCMSVGNILLKKLRKLVTSGGCGIHFL